MTDSEDKGSAEDELSPAMGNLWNDVEISIVTSFS